MRFEVVEIEVDEWGEQHDACRVHHDIDAAELGFDAVEHCRDLIFIGHVGRHDDRATARIGDPVDRFLRAGTITRVVHGDCHPFLCEPDGHGPADAARSSGHDRDAVGHSVLLGSGYDPSRIFVAVDTLVEILFRGVRQQTEARPDRFRPGRGRVSASSQP